MPETPVESKELVREAVACIGCGYDLAGLQQKDDAVCPECGFMLADSIAGPLLRYEDAVWLSRVVKGTRWFHRSARAIVALALILSLLVPVIVWMLMENLFGFDDSNEEAVFNIMTAVAGGCMLALLVSNFPLIIAARWMTTALPEKSSVDCWWRPWVRWGVFSLPAIAIGMLPIAAIENGTPNAPSLDARAIEIALVSGLLFSFMWMYQQGVYQLFDHYDRRCAGQRVLKRIRSIGRCRIGFLVIGLIAIGTSIGSGYIEAYFYVWFCSILTSGLRAKSRKQIIERMSRELVAARAREATIPSP